MPARLPDHFWSSAALFLLPALSLVLPSGYSYAPALLIIVSLVNIRLWWGKVSLPKEVWWMYGSFALLALSWLVDGWLSGERGSALEKPLKILLTLPCLFYLAKRPPQARWLWHGLVVGAIGAASVAVYQALGSLDALRAGWFRAQGFTNAIQFGNLALLLGIMALCGWFAPSRQQTLWRGWLLAGFLSGLLASFLSGSRGGWLALILLAGLFLAYLAFAGYWRSVLAIALIGAAAGFALLQIPQLHMKERVLLIKQGAAGYSTNGIANTSVGARLQMWQFGWDLYRAKPLFGWTQLGYMTEKRLAIDANRLDPMQAEFNHPHNELLDAASKRGTVGLLILVLAYAAPLFAFAHRFKSSAHIEARAISMAGMLIPIAYAAYGLTQSFLPHNSGATMYVYSLVLLCGASIEKKDNPSVAFGQVPTSGPTIAQGRQPAPSPRGKATDGAM